MKRCSTRIRREVPIDGIEVYYPGHSTSRISRYLIYARKHNLLVSAGSDSHGRDYLPVKYPANLCRRLLERVGIEIHTISAWHDVRSVSFS